MKEKRVKLHHKRIFTEEFKKARVKEYETGEYSVSEISRLFNIQGIIIYRWIYKYSNYNKKSAKIVEMNHSSSKKIKELEQKLRELERLVGQKQIEIEYLEKMIEIAKEEFNIDIKKNSNTPQSNGLKKKA